MYSPKIDEALIPKLYRLRRVKRIPMTRLVNQIIATALPALETQAGLSDATSNDSGESGQRNDRQVFAQRSKR